VRLRADDRARATILCLSRSRRRSRRLESARCIPGAGRAIRGGVVGEHRHDVDIGTASHLLVQERPDREHGIVEMRRQRD
jgi:hypothetical protein